MLITFFKWLQVLKWILKTVITCQANAEHGVNASRLKGAAVDTTAFYWQLPSDMMCLCPLLLVMQNAL